MHVSTHRLWSPLVLNVARGLYTTSTIDRCRWSLACRGLVVRHMLAADACVVTDTRRASIISEERLRGGLLGDFS